MTYYRINICCILFYFQLQNKEIPILNILVFLIIIMALSKNFKCRIYERIDVNMEVVPSQSMSASVVQSINSLPGIFFQEESELYDSFCKPSTQPSLSFLFNKSSKCC